MNTQPNSDSQSLSAETQKKKKRAPADTNSLQGSNTKEIRELVQEALTQTANDHKVRLYKSECAKAIIAVLNEFMPAYALVGYDFDGTSIRIINTHNALEADALGAALQKLIMGINFGEDV